MNNNKKKLEHLIEFYKINIEAYRFQINLNWNRNKFYITLNSSLIGVACGLLRIPGFQFAEFLTAPLFILGLFTSFLGLQALLKGIEYRRRTILKKTEIETELAKYLSVSSIDTTAGMREAKLSLDEQEKFVTRLPRFGTISFFLAALFVALMILNAVALGYLFYLKEI